MIGDAKDPLLKAGPEYQRELFRAFAKAAHGFSAEDAAGAAVNVIVAAIRQTQPGRSQAMARLDDWLVQARRVLDSHYDSLGRKRGIFPFEQRVNVEHFADGDRLMNGHKGN